MSANAQRHHRYGVLLSGPAGAGKTAAGLLAFLYCVARGLPCVYIPDASDWVTAAQEGRGDEFFLQTFMRQNADLVLIDPILRAAFAPALAGCPLDALVMARLLEALRTRPGPPVGCIVDEVQRVTAAIADGRAPGAIAEYQRAALYFLQWQSWSTRYQVLVRMDIASANGSREFTLPPGENGRLRIVRPLPIDEVLAVCTAAASPLFIANVALRARAVFIGGGILRLFYQVKYELNQGISMEGIEHSVRAAMLEHCQKWFSKLSDGDQSVASLAMLALIRGEVPWDRVKGLYDNGIVARNSAISPFVEPVSSIAASVIIQVLATHARVHSANLDSFGAGEQRGFELERQLIDSLVPSNRLLIANSLSAKPCPSVTAHSDVALPLHSIADDLCIGALATLFIPLSKQFSCDAITVPEIGNAAPVVLWECSVTDPRDPIRISKVLSWFYPGGIIAQVRAALPGRTIVCALCWDGELVAGHHTKYRDLENAAAELPVIGRGKNALPAVTLAVLGRASLRSLGVHA